MDDRLFPPNPFLTIIVLSQYLPTMSVQLTHNCTFKVSNTKYKMGRKNLHICRFFSLKTGGVGGRGGTDREKEVSDQLIDSFEFALFCLALSVSASPYARDLL